MAAGNFVAQRARATRRQIAPRQLDVLQLAGPDLGDAAAGGEDGVGREELVDLMEDALRLHGDVFVVGLARQFAAHGGQRQHSFGSAGWYPRRLASSSSAASAGLASETMPTSAGSTRADLRRLDIDVDELPLAAIDVDLAGMPVGEAAADANDQVGIQEIAVADGLAHLDAGVAGVERMVVGQPALAHVGHDHREREVLGQRPEFGGGVGEDNAAAQDHDGSLAGGDQVHGLRDRVPGPDRAWTRAEAGPWRDRSRHRPSARRAADRSAPGRDARPGGAKGLAHDRRPRPDR